MRLLFLLFFLSAPFSAHADDGKVYSESAGAWVDPGTTPDTTHTEHQTDTPPPPEEEPAPRADPTDGKVYSKSLNAWVDPGTTPDTTHTEHQTDRPSK